MEIRIVIFDSGKAAIQNRDGDWWCGAYGWVHSNSSHWAFTPDCWNVVFLDWATAIQFAKQQGWIA